MSCLMRFPAKESGSCSGKATTTTCQLRRSAIRSTSSTTMLRSVGSVKSLPFQLPTRSRSQWQVISLGVRMASAVVRVRQR